MCHSESLYIAKLLGCGFVIMARTACAAQVTANTEWQHFDQISTKITVFYMLCIIHQYFLYTFMMAGYLTSLDIPTHGYLSVLNFTTDFLTTIQIVTLTIDSICVVMKISYSRGYVCRPRVQDNLRHALVIAYINRRTGPPTTHKNNTSTLCLTIYIYSLQKSPQFLRRNSVHRHKASDSSRIIPYPAPPPLQLEMTV